MSQAPTALGKKCLYVGITYDSLSHISGLVIKNAGDHTEAMGISLP
jgi:hypothetical protein